MPKILNHLNQLISPPAMLGMLGGGQLGRFFVIAAHEMGYQVTVLDPDANSPAGKIADVHLCAAYDDAKALQTLADSCAAITTEFENVPAETLAFLAQTLPVYPSADSVGTAQHRVREKQFLQSAGLPVAPFIVINRAEDLPVQSDLYPAILKVARFGYDGKGQARVTDRQAALQAYAQFDQEICVLEKMLKLDYEVSVVLARDRHGHIATYQTAENSHLHGILDVTIVPARGSDAINHLAQKLAIQVAEKLDYTGVLAVEFFVCEGELLVNEVAPRPHNSGHFTLDACVTNQFEQQVRVLTGLPLGSSRQHSPAVMVNLLGDVWFNHLQASAQIQTTEVLDAFDHPQSPDWTTLFALPQAKMHLYGKHAARVGRKMGHFTVINTNRDDAIKTAMQVRADLKIGES